jgi:phosphoserine aminotransferase
MKRNDIRFQVIKQMIEEDYVGLFIESQVNSKVTVSFSVSQQEIDQWIECSENDPRFLDNVQVLKNRFPDRNPLD